MQTSAAGTLFRTGGILLPFSLWALLQTPSGCDSARLVVGAGVGLPGGHGGLAASGGVGLGGGTGPGVSEGGAGNGPGGGGVQPPGGAGGGTGGMAGAGGGTRTPVAFVPVDPQISRLWRWTACGSIPSMSAKAIEAVFPPGGDGLAVLYDDGSVQLYPKDDAGATKRLRPAGGRLPASVAFSLDGTLLAEVAAGVVRVRDVASGAIVRDMKASSACTGNAVRFSAEGDHVLAWDQKSLCVWQLADGALATRLAGTFSSAGMSSGRILTAELGAPPVVKSWALSGLDASSVSLAVPSGMAFLPQNNDPSGILVSPRGDTLAGRTAGSELVENLWSAVDGSLLASYPARIDAGLYTPGIVFSESGNRVLLGNEVVDATSLLHFTNTALDDSDPTSIDEAGEQVAGISSQSTAIRVENGVPGARRLFGGLPAVSATGNDYPAVLSVSPDGARLVAATTYTAILWRLASDFAASVPVRILDQALPLEASFSASSGEVLLSGDRWTVLSADDGSQRDYLPAPPVAINSNCPFTLGRLSPSGMTLALGGYTSMVDVLARDGLQTLTTLPSARCDERASFSGDESLLALSGGELYRTSDWSLLWPAQILPAPFPAGDQMYDVFQDVQFAPGDKTLLVSGCPGPGFAEGCAHALHSVADGTLVADLPGLSARHARFSSEGNWIVSGNTALHVPTGESVVFEASAVLSNFAPNGDILAFLDNNTLARYCRTP